MIKSALYLLVVSCLTLITCHKPMMHKVAPRYKMVNNFSGAETIDIYVEDGPLHQEQHLAELLDLYMQATNKRVKITSDRRSADIVVERHICDTLISSKDYFELLRYVDQTSIDFQKSIYDNNNPEL